MYLVYIRPLFEYACEVWDNCGIDYSDKLEKLQLDAARIVTGLPIFTKHLAFWERITPRCLWLVDKGILLPLKENSMLSMLPVLEKNKISVFLGLNDISHLLDQAFSSSRS
jgi:hypothetical protein